MTAEDNAKSYILQILAEHVGEENRIKRKHLLIQINSAFGFQRKHITDRTMRDLIMELRPTEKGFWIVASMREGGGYFMARSYEEGISSMKPDRARIMTGLTNYNKQKRLMKAARSPQIEMII